MKTLTECNTTPYLFTILDTIFASAQDLANGFLTEAGKVLVRRAAHLTVRLEGMEERIRPMSAHGAFWL